MYNLTTGTGLLVEERKALVNALCTALQNHFDDSSAVKATTIADFKIWPTNDDDLCTFGDTWMNTLLQQFGTYLDDADQVRAEWPMLKSAVLETFLSTNTTTTWSQVNRRFHNEYPQVLNFFDLILTIPAMSAACE